MAKNGNVAMLKMRSEEHKDMINGVRVCSLVFLWYMTEAMISKLNVNPARANRVAKIPPRLASKGSKRNGVVSSFEVSFHQQDVSFSLEIFVVFTMFDTLLVIMFVSDDVEIVMLVFGEDVIIPALVKFMTLMS